jgi:hypothetical protein
MVTECAVIFSLIEPVAGSAGAPMRSRALGKFALLFLMFLALPAVPDELITTPLAELFGAAPSLGDPKLSPDGSRMVFLQQNESGVTVLQVLDFKDGSITPLLAGTESGHDINECEFANAVRLLCVLRSAWGPDPLSYQVWVGIDSDGSDLLELPRGIGCGDVYVLRNTHRIDWLPDDPEHIQFNCLRR